MPASYTRSMRSMGCVMWMKTHGTAARHGAGAAEGDQPLLVFLQAQARLAAADQLYERRPAQAPNICSRVMLALCQT